MKEKETPTNHEINSLLKSRWSPRAFDKKAIPEDEVRQILEAGRWAPSSYNMQPWRIIYGLKGTETYDRIMNCLVEFNQSWAKNASVLMLGCYKTTKPDGTENFHALHDLGLFMGLASVQAEHLGIAVHQMAGVDHEEAKKEFELPGEYRVATASALGYYGGDAKEQLPEEIHEQEHKKRERHPQEDFVFNGNFKETYS